jgi:hypothetical protein
MVGQGQKVIGAERGLTICGTCKGPRQGRSADHAKSHHMDARQTDRPRPGPRSV